MTQQMATTERTLAELEAVIERGQQTWIWVSLAYLEIRDRRLYRERGCPTFDDYCQQQWGIARQTAYAYIQAGTVAGNVLTSGQIPSLRQAVELAPLPPEQQREIAERVDFSTATPPGR
jgi:hypothetical protein